MLEQKEKYGEDSILGSVGGGVQKNEDLTVPVNNLTIDALKKKKYDLSKTYVRDSNITFLHQPELYQLIWPYIKEANKNAGWNFEWDYTEQLQFTKYGPGQFYGWHIDSNNIPYVKFDKETDEFHTDKNGDPITDMFGNPIPKEAHKTDNEFMFGKIRKLSVTVSLNDSCEYKGGNLKFDLGPHREDRYHVCKEIRPQGSVVVFPSHLYHQVTPVTEGTRYSLVAWNLGAPWK